MVRNRAGDIAVRLSYEEGQIRLELRVKPDGHFVQCARAHEYLDEDTDRYIKSPPSDTHLTLTTTHVII